MPGRIITPTQIDQGFIVTLDYNFGVDAAQFKEDFLHYANALSPRFVIVEFSELNFIDQDEFLLINSVRKSIEVLGGEVFFVGIKPQIIHFLVKNKIDISGIKAFANAKEAMNTMKV